MSQRDKPPFAAPGVAMRAAAPPAPAINSRELFQGARQVQILHAGQVYILRQTKDNKLILTK